MARSQRVFPSTGVVRQNVLFIETYSSSKRTAHRNVLPSKSITGDKPFVEVGLNSAAAAFATVAGIFNPSERLLRVC